jgi:hypothetical protein
MTDANADYWWIASDHAEEWAGLRIACFLPRQADQPQLIGILGEVPFRSGVRVWDDIVQREGWRKIEQISVPEGWS